MMKRALAMVVLALVSGCAWRTQVEKGTVSTLPLDPGKCYEVDRSHKISGADRAHGIWLLPLGFPDADDAVKKTLAEANEKSPRKVVGLSDTNLKFRLLWLYLYSQRWYSVEGYPIYETK